MNRLARAVLLCATSCATAAHAQSGAGQTGPSTEAAASAAANPTTGEIIVTAQKRGESINSVPMSITAATGLQLKEKGIANVADLGRIEPSLKFSQTAYGTPVYTIRGVGYFEESLAASPTVSIYQDEISYPFPVMSRGVLLDPERVEILKGPQGTLYGQNATAGAINFIAAKPTETFKFGLDDSFGKFNDNLLSGFVSGPLTSTLSARLSGSIEEGGAWQKSETRNDTLGNKDTMIGRLILEWKPTDKFKASLNLNGWVDHSDTQAAQLEGVYFVSPQFISPDALTPASANHLPNSAYYASYPASIQNEVKQPTDLSNDRQADWGPGTHPRNDETFYQASLRLDYTFSDAVGLTSLTSYERFKENNLDDEGGVGADYVHITVKGDVETVSQELRLHGQSSDSKLHWLVGGNYESDKSREADFFDLLGSSAYLTGGSPFSAVPLAPFTYSAKNDVNTETLSVFGNADYRLLSTVNLHAGVRYTRSRQDIASCAYGDTSITAVLDGTAQALAAASGGPAPTNALPGQCVTIGPAPSYQPGVFQTKLDEHNVPWKVGIDWTPIPHELLYVTVSKGYKAGASASIGASTYHQLIPVTQESILSIETGAKLSLFDRRLQINAAYFHYNYTNKQEIGELVDPIFGVIQALVNIPKSVEDGAELSAKIRPVDGLTLDGSVTYLDSRVTSDFFNYSAYSTGAADAVNFKGEPFPFTPKWSMQYGARYDWNLSSQLSAFVSADASYQTRASAAFGSMEAITYNAPREEIKAYGILNLTAGVESADKHWRVEVWGKNVTNTYYWNSSLNVDDGIVRLAGLPATYGVSLHYRY